MSKIHLLDKQVAELIAAGEVVERPASIVKELAENAVDAGAAAITVEIKDGGVSYIRITDNGSGIAREEVATAFLRHATSKLRVSEDLEHILTMGFRGEALASIAAMSRVELLTRTAEETAGTRYVICGGEQQLLEDAGCPVGTTIIVRDVFYNTPARMKFLKKDVSEGNSVAAVVEKAALAYPNVSFRLLRDGVQKLHTPGDRKLISAVRCTMGKEFSDGCIPVDYTFGGLRLHGLISKPQAARGSRALQNFFINQRFIRSKTCMAAFEEAYRGSLMTGRFPSCVLNLSIPPQTVDVNVHPAKTEVRFAEEKNIFSLVHYGCKTALGAADLTPSIKAQESPRTPAFPKPPEFQQQHICAQQYRALAGRMDTPPAERKRLGDRVDTLPANLPPMQISWQPDIETPPEAALDLKSENALQQKTEQESPKIPIWRPADFSAAPMPEEIRSPDPFEGARLIGELFDTYILLQNGDDMLLIDKHAAHERLLFNRMMSGGLAEDRQLLIAPVSVRLSSEEYSAVLENLPLLAKAGLTMEDFGNNFVLIREVAPPLANADLPVMVAELAGKLLNENKQLVSRQMIDLYHIAACRAAIKANDKTSLLSLAQLVALLREDADARHCPHGRPVVVRMEKHEIEKKFGRLG